MTSLIDPDCKVGKHASCFGGPCQCPCHEVREVHVQPLPAQTVAALAAVASFIVDRHRPDVMNAATQGLTCQACSLLAGIPVGWPCPDRAVVGDLFPDPSNRLLPETPAATPSLDAAGALPANPPSG